MELFYEYEWATGRNNSQTVDWSSSEITYLTWVKLHFRQNIDSDKHITPLQSKGDIQEQYNLQFIYL